jgi:MEMO1 family protein
MIKNALFLLSLLLGLNLHAQKLQVRPQKDTIGFASQAWQMDSVMYRCVKTYHNYYDFLYKNQNPEPGSILRFAICPHDDYTYAGFLYNEIFCHIKAKTIIIFGVAHKAKKFGIEQKIVFDDFKYWHAPYGNIEISPLRQQIISALPQTDYLIHDSLQITEHSVEAFIPFIQVNNKDAEIISILVPHMPFCKMQIISEHLAKAIYAVIKSNHLKWGKDIALVVSTDAVHYGDEDWGGNNYAPFGCDSTGYKKAIEKEHNIMHECLETIDTLTAKKFFGYTVQDTNWREYKWTWCGRYSVPFAMLTAYKLQQISGETPVKKLFYDYSNSIEHPPLNVDDLNMGATAPASLHHWVGYCAAGYY